VALDVCTWSQVIGKDDPWTKEHVISHVHALKDHHLVLDGYAVSDSGAVLHESTVTDIAITANTRARQDVGKCPDSGPRTDVVAFTQPLRMYEDTVE
jgi:hypothetical protein